MESFRDLIVYRKAYGYSLEVHKLSLKFPGYEQPELGGQIRRATKSIPMNIAEGFGRRSSTAELKRFLSIARGSCDEVSVQLEYCKDLQYITEAEYARFVEYYAEVGKMLTGMIKKWQ